MANDVVTGGFLNRINSRADSIAGQTRHSEWVQANTSHNGQNFSFKDHEMQVQIFDDPASRLAVKKCSQIGLSELLVRKLATIMAVMRYVRVIYTLPTRQFAMKFSKDRIDSVINQSEALKGLLQKGSDSVEQKIFVNSNAMYVTGTFGDSSAISIPANYVVNDEVDFSNLEVVGKMSSRLRHAPINPDGIRGYHYKFSTPTLPGYGISEAFDAGSQQYYMVKCKCCNHQQAPSWYHDFIIPGYDDDITELDKNLILSLMDKGLHEDAYIKCQKCGRDLMPSLLDPKRRQWVATHPNRKNSSYQISPWDVPVYNTPTSILMQMPEYKRQMDFYNFVLGLEYEDADSVFLSEIFSTRNNAVWQQPNEGFTSSYSTVIGMDVGKICHFTVGVSFGSKLHIIYAEEISHSAAKPAMQRIKTLLTAFNCGCFCLDSGPDITLVRELLEWCALEQIPAYASEYVRKIGLKDIEPDDITHIVKVNRTNTFTGLMKDHNQGNIEYVADDRAPIMSTFKAHVCNLKKIQRELVDGDMLEQIVKTGPDHFGHSLNYCNIARLLLGEVGNSELLGVLPGITGVTMQDPGDLLKSMLNGSDPFAAYRKH